MNLQSCVTVLLLIFTRFFYAYCWTDEDLELFDLVESTDRKFYDILGVDQKAPAAEIRKAYRKLSQLYHPDKNKEPDAEETFRKIAAIADVLRNEEQRKKYDIILQTGLPDWREPIYYYRRVRNMGMVELIIFLFCLATLGQYLFAWSAYWEKKYEIEELVLSKIKKRAKHQRKSRSAKTAEEAEAIAAEIINLPKPKCQDLFPVQLVYLIIHLVQSSPSHLKQVVEGVKCLWKSEKYEDEDYDYEGSTEKKVRQRGKKHIKPQFPEMISNYSEQKSCKLPNGTNAEHRNGKIPFEKTEINMNEFRKALKKIPNGTLQRWEKIAEFLNCSVSEVVALAKEMKSQPFVRSVPASAQGLTGSEDNTGCIDVTASSRNEFDDHQPTQNGGNHIYDGTVSHRAKPIKDLQPSNMVEKVWSQEEQKLLELALLKFPKDALARWDRIADFLQTRTKEECITRYKELAQQIKKKKGKEN